MHETVWYGRGGQGVVMASEIFAEAAYIEGFRGVTSAPTFGPERRGAPLTASTKIAKDPIRSFAQIDKADMIVVLDDSLFEVMDIGARLKQGGAIIINTNRPEIPWNLNGAGIVASVDAAGIAFEKRLSIRGTPIVNTALLGAVAKASDIVSMKSIIAGLGAKIPSGKVGINASAAEAAFQKLLIHRN